METAGNKWKIVSGGQTGADRAGLAAAMASKMPIGGWVPRGRRAEDGTVPSVFYGMREHPKSDYRARTRANVVDSDATLILTDRFPLSRGTALTARLASELGRPCKVVHVADPDAAAKKIADWMRELEERGNPGGGRGFRVLNVAGPRESVAPGIFEKAKAVLVKAFADLRAPAACRYEPGDGGFGGLMAAERADADYRSSED